MRSGSALRGAAPTAAIALLTLIPGVSIAQGTANAAGRADLNGTWENGAGIPFVRPQRMGASICLTGCPEAPELGGLPGGMPPLDRPKYKPEFVARVNDLDERQVAEDPILRCENPGLPRIGPPDKIVQTQSEVIFLYDDVNGNFFRIVPTDGRGHRTDVEATSLGDSIGHWEGDTLVVETVNFNDDTWLIDDGSFHSTGLRVVERLSRTGDELEWQATAYDPAVLAEPWAKRARIATLTDQEIVQAPPCLERDLPIMNDASNHDNDR